MDFEFDTILKADFFRASNQAVTVTGSGVCALTASSGRRLANGETSQENASVRLAFTIGGDEDQNPSNFPLAASQYVPEYRAEESQGTTNWLILNMAMSFLASMVSLAAVFLAIKRRRPVLASSSPDHPDNYSDLATETTPGPKGMAIFRRDSEPDLAVGMADC